MTLGVRMIDTNRKMVHTFLTIKKDLNSLLDTIPSQQSMDHIQETLVHPQVPLSFSFGIREYQSSPQFHGKINYQAFEGGRWRQEKRPSTPIDTSNIIFPFGYLMGHRRVFNYLAIILLSPDHFNKGKTTEKEMKSSITKN